MKIRLCGQALCWKKKGMAADLGRKADDGFSRMLVLKHPLMRAIHC